MPPKFESFHALTRAAKAERGTEGYQSLQDRINRLYGQGGGTYAGAVTEFESEKSLFSSVKKPVVKEVPTFIPTDVATTKFKPDPLIEVQTIAGKDEVIKASSSAKDLTFRKAAGQAVGIATSAYDLTKIGEKDVVGQVGTVASALGSLGTAASTGGILSGAAAAGGTAGAFLTALTGPVGIGLMVGGSLLSMLGKNTEFGLR